LGVKTNITAFEINETTAKIAKIFHPEADIHLRSFETEFIDEKVIKRNFLKNMIWLLVIHLTEHRGFTKVWEKNRKSQNMKIILLNVL
jgi:thiamine kinase-like enzyme